MRCAHQNIRRFTVLALLATGLRAGDWPQWRYDAARSGTTDDELPDTLHLQWVRDFPPPSRAWPDSQKTLQFDRTGEPVVSGQTLLYPCSATDCLIACDTRTGNERWRFYAEGPIRFAPVATSDNVYVASDDGYLYCLDLLTGTSLWKRLGGPRDQRIIGNQRLISVWPIRGGPVLYEGTLYFTAGIWPFQGIFIHAIKAASGESVWLNSGLGSSWSPHPHGSLAFGSVAPQGYLAAGKDVLLVPGGRTAPAVFDRRTGDLRYYHEVAWFRDKKPINHGVGVTDSLYFHRCVAYHLQNGRPVGTIGCGVFTTNAFYGSEENGLVIRSLLPTGTPPQARPYKNSQESPFRLEYPPRILLKAGSRLFGSHRDGRLVAIRVTETEAPREVWQTRIDAPAWSMLAGDDRLFVVTENGRLYAFGASPVSPAQFSTPPFALPAGQHPLADTLSKLTREKGYAVILQSESTTLTLALLASRPGPLLVIDPNTNRVARLRRELTDAGFYGRRVTVWCRDPLSAPLPPYLADLIVADSPAVLTHLDAENARRLLKALRPYGGVAWLETGTDHSRILACLHAANVPGITVKDLTARVLARRAGPLPGSAPWTHQHADPGNRLFSRDRLVRAPLGLLWFGGPPNDLILPRHGHGPNPLVCNGRLFIQGRNLLRAMDVYTGDVLWERTMPHLGEYYDTVRHQPGANETGGNLVALPDALYVVTPEACLRLNPDDGKISPMPQGAADGGFALPPLSGASHPFWGNIRCWEDLLIATAGPSSVVQLDNADTSEQEEDPFPSADRPAPSPDEQNHPLADFANRHRYGGHSRWLLAYDRIGGRLLWSRKAQTGFRHNAIAVGNERVFCIDGMTAYAAERLAPSTPRTPSTLYALDARTGAVIWKTDKDIFGTWLAYSQESDLLLEATSRRQDWPRDESGYGLTVFRGRDGQRLWQNRTVAYQGPCLLGTDTVWSQTLAVTLRSGRPLAIPHPLTGLPIPWILPRSFGCGYVVGCDHLFLFRSGAAGYYDLERHGGTGNFGGFRSGCSANLIPADGVLNAPDYTRTCSCLFQNQCSLALVHAPEEESWTMSAFTWDGQRVQRVGINIGAPGDRKDESGTLWLDCPSVGGPSPDIPVRFQGSQRRLFRHHSSLFQGPLSWVASSGITGVERIGLLLSNEKTPFLYTLRLIFAEPDPNARAGDRMFDVKVQGRVVLSHLDVCQQAGGPRRTLLKVIPNVAISDILLIDWLPRVGQPVVCGLELSLQPYQPAAP